MLQLDDQAGGAELVTASVTASPVVAHVLISKAKNDGGEIIAQLFRIVYNRPIGSHVFFKEGNESANSREFSLIQNPFVVIREDWRIKPLLETFELDSCASKILRVEIGYGGR